MSSSTRASLLFVFFAAAFTYGLIRLFSLQFASGDVYPELSSLRADPNGAKLLYDTLALTKGVTVSRNYLPLDSLGPAGAVILVLAANPEAFDNEPALKAFESLAERGNRVVAAMNWEQHEAPPGGEEWNRRWHIRFGYDAEPKHTHHLYFAEAEGWQVTEQVAGRSLAIERAFGKGTVKVARESLGVGEVSELTEVNSVTPEISPSRRSRELLLVAGTTSTLRRPIRLICSATTSTTSRTSSRSSLRSTRTGKLRPAPSPPTAP